MKELTMTIPQFLAVQRAELTYKEIIQAQREINRSYKLKKYLVVSFACNLMLEKYVYAADTSRIDVAGHALLSTAQQIGYWACLVMCLIEVIMALISRRTDDVKKICTKYILGFASLYFMPWIFDFIRDFFGGM